MLELDRELKKLKFSDSTRRIYGWQARHFLTHYELPPEEITNRMIDNYFKKLVKEKKSRSFFLQACSGVEVLYDYVVGEKPYGPGFFAKLQKKYLR